MIKQPSCTTRESFTVTVIAAVVLTVVVVVVVAIIIGARIRHDNAIQKGNLTLLAIDLPSHRKQTHISNHWTDNVANPLLRIVGRQDVIVNLRPNGKVSQLEQLNVAVLGGEALGLGLERVGLVPLGKRQQRRLRVAPGRGGPGQEHPLQVRVVEDPAPPARPLVDARAELVHLPGVGAPQAAADEGAAPRLAVDVVAGVRALAAGT